ncbi:MAG TPA: response regulator transcription factor [Albitalea sp.]|nr:response regulator transcription factor [Albitalea sp.]
MHAWPAESPAGDVVLIVDDVPDNLSLLHDALDEAGYTVLVATAGEAALLRAAQALPDIVLLDAVMPGLDGFEVARRLKAQPDTAHIPIVFMTGLTETEHVVAAFEAGGVDYVTKPIRPREVLARIAAHMQGARQARQARNALDAFGHATMAVHIGSGRAVWQTPLARRLLQSYFGAADACALAPAHPVPPPLLAWLQAQSALAAQGQAPRPLALVAGSRQLVLSLQERTSDEDWLIVMREVSDTAVVQALMQGFRLTLREAEALYWVAKGKTNRDIGDILGSSPATVKKHLEHVYEKLGVETRTAAANLAMSRVASLVPR